jgi:DNA-binding CsgD family transcriptional regulator
MKIIDLVNNQPSQFLVSLLKDVWSKPNSPKFSNYYATDVKLYFRDQVLGADAIRNRIENFLKFSRLELAIENALAINDLIISQGRHIGFDDKTKKYFMIQTGIVYRMKESKITEVWLLDNVNVPYESAYYDDNSSSLERDVVLQFLTKIVSKALTKRELECLFLMLEGKTAKEIAIILKISYRTVETYLEKIKIKLNCQHKHELRDKLLPIGLWT